MKGFSQKEGVDFIEIFLPIIKMSSIRVIIVLVGSLDCRF